MSEIIVTKHLKLKAPFNAIVAGPSGCGKTYWVRQLLTHFKQLTTIEATELNVIWCYGQYQEAYRHPVANANIKYREGLLSDDELTDMRPHIVVIDDLQNELSSNKEMANLFMKKSHHLGCSVILLLQNIYAPGSQMRNISLNSHYNVAFKNNRDEEQLLRFGRQVAPQNRDFFSDVLKDVFSKEYGYILIDCHPSTPNKLKFRTDVFPHGNVLPSPTVYVPR